ncbi:MAG: hypothetical protein AAB682_02890 [Patescibacteria group bacterium]
MRNRIRVMVMVLVLLFVLSSSCGLFLIGIKNILGGLMIIGLGTWMFLIPIASFYKEK